MKQLKSRLFAGLRGSMTNKLFACSSALAGVVFLSGTAHAWNTSGWGDAVWPYPAPAVATSRKLVSSGGVEGGIAFFCNDLDGLFDPNAKCGVAAPEDAEVKVRVSCSHSKFGLGARWYEGSWVSNLGGPFIALSRVDCPSNLPFAVDWQVRVRSNVYPFYFYFTR